MIEKLILYSGGFVGVVTIRVWLEKREREREKRRFWIGERRERGEEL